MKQAIRGLLRRLGYDLMRYQPGRPGYDPFQDMKFFLKGVESPTILDVGANIGQSVDLFKTTFPDSRVHCFQPSPSTYSRLSEHCEAMSGVTTWNHG